MKYTLNAGRLIEKDGAGLATLHGVGQYDPCEVDDLARTIVAKLNTQHYSDEAKAVIGANIARILQLRRDPGFKPRRWKTTWGNKTDIGIFETVRVIGQEIENLPTMRNDLRREGGGL